MRMILSGSSCSGGVGVGVGFRRGGGGGSPSVGAIRSVVGRVVCGVGVGLGLGTGGVAAGLAGCVLRGRSWPRPAIPREETIKTKTASTPINLRFFSRANVEHLRTRLQD